MAAQAWTGCSLFVLLALIEALCGTHLMRLPVCEAAKLMILGALSAVASSFYCFSMTRLEAPVALTLLFQYSWLGISVQLVLDDRKLTHKEVSGLFATYGGQHSLHLLEHVVPGQPRFWRRMRSKGCDMDT